ncbi:MAG: hypothetical protein ACOYZ8_16425 [Chloroflexota bacterium]
MRLTALLKSPLVVGILAGILGLVLGLVYAWYVDPLKVTDTTPELLRADLQEDYLRMAIDSFILDPQNTNAAIDRWMNLGPNAPVLLAKIQANPGTQDPGAILAYRTVIESVLGPIGAEPIQPVSTTSTFNVILIGAAVLAVAAVAVVGAFVFFRGILRGRAPRTGEVSAAMQAQEINRSVERTDFQALGLQTPITQTMTTYVLGDDLYDESFSIDSPAGEFLGEYGVGVSETIGVGEPKKVTAIEIWLFDKNDIKTATKVLMSPHAFNDPAIRSRLEAKGELVPIQPQGQIVLETATLQLLATVVDLEYGQGAMPVNSFFERITLELAIWPKQK